MYMRLLRLGYRTCFARLVGSYTRVFKFISLKLEKLVKSLMKDLHEVLKIAQFIIFFFTIPHSSCHQPK